MSDITVIGDRILVRRITGKEAKTAGGLIMPTVSKEGGRDTQWGTVLAVSQDWYTDHGHVRSAMVSVGDEVAFGYHVGWFVAEGEELMVISERDVVAVRQPAKPLMACISCGHAVAMEIHRTARGWMCDRCDIAEQD